MSNRERITLTTKQAVASISSPITVLVVNTTNAYTEQIYIKHTHTHTYMHAYKRTYKMLHKLKKVERKKRERRGGN